jgi:hypothetical protein
MQRRGPATPWTVPAGPPRLPWRPRPASRIVGRVAPHRPGRPPCPTSATRSSRPSPTAPPARRAGYDAAKTTNENRKHWAEADALAPVSQLTPAVRRTLRNRSRYECPEQRLRRRPDPHAGRRHGRHGPAAADAHRRRRPQRRGRGPLAVVVVRHQPPLNDPDPGGVKYVAGECFASSGTRKRLEKLGYPVTLDLRLVEPDQVTDGFGGQPLPDHRRRRGRLRRRRRGGRATRSSGITRATTAPSWAPSAGRRRIPAENVLHWFQPERPGQLRGVTPAGALPRHLRPAAAVHEGHTDGGRGRVDARRRDDDRRPGR